MQNFWLIDFASNAEVFLLVSCRVLPTTDRREFLLDFFRTPRLRFIFIDWCAGTQDWIDDAPGFFYIILAGKKRGIPRHGVSKNSLVGLHLVWTWMVAVGDISCTPGREETAGTANRDICTAERTVPSWRPMPKVWEFWFR